MYVFMDIHNTHTDASSSPRPQTCQSPVFERMTGKGDKLDKVNIMKMVSRTGVTVNRLTSKESYLYSHLQNSWAFCPCGVCGHHGWDCGPLCVAPGVDHLAGASVGQNQDFHEEIDSQPRRSKCHYWRNSDKVRPSYRAMPYCSSSAVNCRPSFY